MVKTASTMVDLGVKAPDFSLPDVSGKMVSLSDFADAPALWSSVCATTAPT